MGSLEERLRRRIERDGPLTFADFMEAALYDPAEGFYSGSRGPAVGRDGHFVTGPHVSPAFGWALARQLSEMWRLLDRPNPFAVVEVGAGDGALAAVVLAALPPEVREATSYIAVERSAAGRAALASLPVTVASFLEDVDGDRTGCLLANELLDNLPFHRVRRTADGLRELVVSVHEGRLVLVEGPPPPPELAGTVPPLAVGQDAAVSPGGLRFVDHAAEILGRGYVWLSDYGHDAGEAPGAVHGYRNHGVVADVLADPGSRDITAGVDFAALAARARAAGLSVWGPTPQRDVLLALGMREWDRHERERQLEAREADDAAEAARIFSGRQRATLLTDPAAMGSFLVLCLGIGTDRPPAWAAGRSPIDPLSPDGKGT